MASAGTAHRLDGGQGAVHRAEGVDLEGQPALVLVLLPDGAGEEDAGVVDPDVEPIGERDDPVAGTVDGRLVPDVHDERLGPVTELGRGSLRRGLVDVREQHGVAALDEEPGDEPAETPTGAGDDGPGGSRGRVHRPARIVP